MASTFCQKYIVWPDIFCWYLHHTVTTGPGFSSSAFATNLLVSTISDRCRSLLKKSGLSKVVNFSGIGKRRPDFLKRNKAMAVPMMIAVMTNTTGRTTRPRVWGSTWGTAVQIQHIDDEPVVQIYNCKSNKEYKVIQLTSWWCCS